MTFTGMKVITRNEQCTVVESAEGVELLEIRNDQDSEQIIITLHEKVPFLVNASIPPIDDIPFAVVIGQSLSEDTDEYVAIATIWENVIVKFD